MQCIHEVRIENISVSKTQKISRTKQFLKNASQNREINGGDILTLNLTNIAWYFKGGGLGTKLNETTARKVEMSLSIINRQ